MAEESEISKRIDDLHRRFDDLRGDMNTRLGELREDMSRWVGVVDTRFGELRADMNPRFTGMEQRLKTLHWVIPVWFSLLTLLTVLFKFLRF